MLSPKEKLFVDAFQKKLIDEPDVFDLDLSLVNSFILWSDATIKNDYENRKPILSISNNLKRKCAYIITKKPDDEELVRACADTIWKLRLFEAQNRQLDSYLLYLEKNREPKDKFYQPKRKQFWKIGIIQALQKMIDGDLEILSISLPPGTGKAQPLYSKVLTPSGFKKMGDIKVGDAVVSASGNNSVVTHVFPQGKKSVYQLELEDGSKCRCSDEHLWHVRYWHIGRCFEKAVELKTIIWQKHKYQIPVYCDGDVFYLRIANIDYVGEEECQCIMIDDPCHLYITDDYIVTHNTTMSKFFISAIMGWNPEGYNLFFSHSNDITRMYYDGVLNIITDHSEYTWSEIFPGLKVNQQNAKMQQFNLGSYKPFPSLQCTSRNSNNAGVVRCSDFLLVDDLVSGIEEALNKAQLDKLWDKYRVDARQRKVDGCREIHIATRWSTVDVIGRLQALYADTDKKCEFIAVPDIDPETGRSNFEYDYNGFSAEFFHDQELAMDEISYRCLYRQDPIEREGLLYPEDELRRYVTLPNQEPDAVIGVCDTKSTGIDDMVLPVMYKYDDDYYMEACVCDDNADFGVQIAKLSEIIVEHNMQQCEFESNAGGDRLARDVALEVQKQGGRCNITSKPTETNKETRIIVNSDWVKKHVLFKDKELYSKKSDYGRFMSKLTTHSVVGKNRTDDVPDCLANFALFVTRSLYRRKTRIMKSPI